jgi:2-keto-4-pentenoate hydratase/2-oxohepta-3-ene-1,7-dioic acid hydratase in catechol pathway
MKLLRVGAKGQECPALLDSQGVVRSLANIVRDIDASVLSKEGLASLRKLNVADLPVVADVSRIGTPWVGCGKFICIGLNYADHAREAGMPIPTEPILFTKAISAITGYLWPHRPLAGDRR